MGNFCDYIHLVFYDTKIARVFNIDRRRIRACRPFQFAQIECAPFGIESNCLNPCAAPFGIGFHHIQSVRADVGGYEDLTTAGQASGHVGCLTGSGGPVIDRVDDHIHADHFSHHALKFKKSLHLTFFRFR